MNYLPNNRLLLLGSICAFMLSMGPAPHAAAHEPGVINAADYDSLQAACDAVPETGGSVFIPPGRYELPSPLVIRTAETQLAGAGAATHLVNTNTDGEPAIHLRPDGYADDKKQRIWRVQLKDFRVSGNPASGDGVLCQGIQEVFIQGVSVDHHGGDGIHLENCYEDPRIADSIITYNAKAGLHLDACHDIVVSANQFEENNDALRCLDSFNLCMNGNNLDDHLRHGVVIENTYGSVLSGNMIEECNGTAVVLDRDCYGITISANVIAHELGGGVDLIDAHGCAISGNTFVLVHRFGVRVGQASGRITITGNNFSNSHIGGKEKRPFEPAEGMSGDAGSGVVLIDTAHVVVSANTFSGLSDFAIQTRGACRGILLTNNCVTDVNRRTSSTQAIYISPGTESSIVKDNLLAELPIKAEPETESGE